MNSITIAGFPVYAPPPGQNFAGVNSFSTHSGAGRFGTGRFLMRRADYNSAVTAAGNTGATTLVMASGTHSITLPVTLAGAIAGSLSVAPVADVGTKDGDMVECVVLDRRCKLVTPNTAAYNVQQDGFPSTGDASTDFYPATLNAGAEWTWTTAVADLDVFGGASLPTLPTTYKPRNLIYDGIPEHRVADDIATRMRWIVGWDYDTGKPTVWLPGTHASENSAIADAAMVYRQSGGLTARNPARLPGKFSVKFPAGGTTGDPYQQRFYTKTITNEAGDTTVTMPLICGEYIAIRNSDDTDFTNKATLDIVAADVAARTFGLMNVDVGEYAFAGLWPFKLDGAVRGIKWIMDAEGARTVVRLNNESDFQPLQDLRRATEAVSNTLIVGGGPTFVGMTTSGTRMVWGGGAAHGGGTLPDGTADYQVLEWNNTARTWGPDWVRAHG